MNTRIIKLLPLFIFVFTLSSALMAQPDNLPKKKASKMSRLAKVFGFGKKTKVAALAPPVQQQRQTPQFRDPIKSKEQRDALNKAAAKLPPKQRNALFFQARQEKYAIKQQNKAIQRAQAQKRMAAQARPVPQNPKAGAAQKFNPLSPSPGKLNGKLPSQPKTNAAAAQGAKPISPGQLHGKLPAPPKTNAVAKQGAKQISPGQLHGKLPPPPKTNASAKQGAKQISPGQLHGKLPPPPKSNAVTRQGAKQISPGQLHGKLPPVSATKVPTPAPKPNIVTRTPPPAPGQIKGKIPTQRQTAVPPAPPKPGVVQGAKPLPPGQQHGKIPSKSGVVYGKLPGGSNPPPPKNTKNNVKEQLKKKAYEKPAAARTKRGKKG